MGNSDFQRDRLTLCLLAGESSGDILGGKLMVALKKNSTRPIDFIGIGGERMQKEGLVSFFPIDDISVMGISEVLPYLSLIHI